MRRSSDVTPSVRVADDQRDVGALGRALGAQLRVVVDRAGDLRAAAQARPCRPARAAARRPRARVSIASRVVPACSLDDHAVLAEERVHERRLADVRPADHREPNRVGVGLARLAPRARGQRPRAGRAGRRCRRRARRTPAPARPGRARGTRPPPARPRRGRACSPTTIAGMRRAAQQLGQLGVAGPQRRRVASTTSSTAVGVAEREPRLLLDLARQRVARRSRSTPPVSTSVNSTPFHSAGTSLRSRVTPGSACVTVSRVPLRRLTSVDLPTFG